MRRGIGLVSLAFVAAALLAAPAGAEDAVCTRQADPNPAAHPGVVLGPATKCVRSGDAVAPAGGIGARADEPREFPWAPIAASAALLSVSGVSAVRRRRRSVSRQPSARAA